MAKKKQQHKNKKGIVAVAIILLIAVGIIGFPVWQNIYQLNKGYIMIVNDVKVAPGEYRFVLSQQTSGYEDYYGSDVWGWDMGDGSTMGQYMMSNAIDTVIYTKLCAEQARTLGIELTDDEKASALETFDYIKENYDKQSLKYVGLNDKKLLNFIEENLLCNKVYSYYTDDYVLNEADFDTYFEEYFDTNYQSLVTLMADYIVTTSYDDSIEIVSRLDEGEEINSLVAEYSSDAEDRPEPESVSITADSFPQEVVDAAYAMQEGEYTETPILYLDQTNEVTYFYVLRVTEIIQPDMDELTTEQQESYISDQKQSIFDENYSSWYSDMKFEINEPLFYNIKIKGVTFVDNGDNNETDNELDNGSNGDTGGETDGADAETESPDTEPEGDGE